jgi:TfoX/Sxy family transcriptional regulator of competence genes
MKKTTTKGRTKASATKPAKARPRPPETTSKVKTAAVTMDPAFQPVAAAFAKNPEVGLGRMFSSNSVLNVNGKIFAMFVKSQFVAKLPKERVAELVGKGAGTYFDPGHGRLMKEWIAIADTTAPWVALAREAHSFVKAGSR